MFIYFGPAIFTINTYDKQMKKVGHGEFISNQPSTRGSEKKKRKIHLKNINLVCISIYDIKTPNNLH